jgi:hypothetical protein
MDTSEHFPMTTQQRGSLIQDMAEIHAKLEDIATLARSCFGADGEPCIRAEEAKDALQRLQWALNRELKSTGLSLSHTA